MKKVFLLIIILCAFSLLFAACETNTDNTNSTSKTNKVKAKKSAKKSNENWMTLSDADRQYLIGVARNAFEHWVKKHDKFKPDEVPENLKNMKVNRVFATVYKDGEWRGCVSSKGRNLITTVVNAVINTCKDKRFDDPREDELEHFRVELSFLQPFEEIKSKDADVIRKELEPGVHGISIRHSSGKRAFFLPYVFVKKYRKTITWLERICKKAGLPKDAWKSPETSIFKFNTINFIEEESFGKSVDLYRYKVEMDEVKDNSLKVTIKNSVSWFLNNYFDETNRFATGFDNKHRPLKEDSDILQIMALSALALADELDIYPKKLSQAVNSGLQGVRDSLVDEKGKLSLDVQGVDKLEATLIFADFIALASKLKDQKKMAKKLAAFIRENTGRQKAISAKGRYVKNLPNFAVYVMARLAAITGDKKDKKHLGEMFGTYWKSGQLWSLAAVAYTAKVLNTEDMIQKVTDETASVIAIQYTNKTASYRDYVGAFNNGKTPTTKAVSIYLRGLAAAYGLIQDNNGKIKADALLCAMYANRWLMEQQFTKISAFYFKNYADLIGCFKHDIIINKSRIDDTAYALIGLLDSKKYFGDKINEAFKANAKALIK